MTSPNLIAEIQNNGDDTRQFRRHMGQVSRHSGMFFAGTLFTAAVGYLFKIYLARVLGASNLGIYTLGMTLVGFLGIFNLLGLHRSALRYIAVYSATGQLARLRGFLGRSLLILMVCNVVMGAAMLLFGSWFGKHFYHTDQLKPYLGLLALIMLLGALTAFLGQVLGGYKAVGQRTVVTNFICTPVTVLITVVLVAAGLGLRGYILAQVGSAAVVLILLGVLAWRHTPMGARDSSLGFPPLERDVVSFSGAVLGLGVLEFIMAQTDRVMLGFYLDARRVGIYAVAGAVVTFVPIVLRSVSQIFGPIIADLHARQQQVLLGRLYQTITKWTVGLTLPLAAATVILAYPLMGIFGADFQSGWPVVVIGTVGQLVSCAVGTAGTMLLMSGNQRSLIRIQIVTSAIMIGVNLALIPSLGIVGAAIAAAATTAMTNLWYLVEIRKHLGLFPYNRGYWRLIPPAVGAVGVLLLLQRLIGRSRPEWLVVAAGLVLAYAVFAGITLAFGLDADDRLVVDAMWSKIRSIVPMPASNF